MDKITREDNGNILAIGLDPFGYYIEIDDGYDLKAIYLTKEDLLNLADEIKEAFDE